MDREGDCPQFCHVSVAGAEAKPAGSCLLGEVTPGDQVLMGEEDTSGDVRQFYREPATTLLQGWKVSKNSTGRFEFRVVTPRLHYSTPALPHT
ncbi:mCG55467 [Mus musculus]|nr:mCG55467 [Mus musculus]